MLLRKVPGKLAQLATSANFKPYLQNNCSVSSMLPIVPPSTSIMSVT